MKKTLVALSVLAAAAAGSVNAAEVYNNDGVSVSLSGAGEVQFYQTYEKEGTDVSQEIRIDDAQIDLTVGVDITDGLTAVAGLNQTFEANSNDDDTNRNVKSDGAYVGFASDTLGTVTFGDQYLITDDSGIGADFEVGYGQYGQETTNGTDVIKYVYDNGQFYFGISHDLDEGDTDNTTDETSTDGRIGFRAGGLDARLYVFKGESVDFGSDIAGNDFSASKGDEDGYNLEVVYTFNDAWSMAASYGNDSKDINNAEVSDVNIFEINATYTMDQVNAFSLGYVNADDDASGVRAEANNLYGVYVRTLNSNVRAYAEVGYVDVDQEDVADSDYDLAYTVGMEVSF
ncbi:porin [Vibrio salinus]|uniref:porin n=1 Tax=Vibrio salinus TaxID=2899784 RepID=UPI001E4D75B0|nr:porin [Vibrio salinus]MCE0492831.1 porin [Vibrio salinus]